MLTLKLAALELTLACASTFEPSFSSTVPVAALDPVEARLVLKTMLWPFLAGLLAATRLNLGVTRVILPEPVSAMVVVPTEVPIDKDAERAPVAVGLKMKLTVHLAAGARVVPQVCVCEKSPGFVPVRVKEPKVNVAPPLLVRVTVLTALFLPTG